MINSRNSMHVDGIELSHIATARGF